MLWVLKRRSCHEIRLPIVVVVVAVVVLRRRNCQEIRLPLLVIVVAVSRGNKKVPETSGSFSPEPGQRTYQRRLVRFVLSRGNEKIPET